MDPIPPFLSDDEIKLDGESVVLSRGQNLYINVQLSRKKCIGHLIVIGLGIHVIGG